MICSICEKKGETSVVDSRPTEDGTAIEEEDFVFVEQDLLLLKEFNIEK